jgi:hypothetical protein
LDVFSRLVELTSELHDEWFGTEFSILFESKEFSEVSSIIWKYLKTVLFSSIILTQPFIDFLANNIRKNNLANNKYLLQITPTIMIIYEIYRNVYFIAERFGTHGIPTLEKQLKVLAASLMVKLHINT